MKVAKLSGSLRENVGKKSARALRTTGQVPAVIYGAKEQVHIAINDLDAEKIIFTPEVYQVDLTIDGKEISTIIQDIQQDPITGKIRHIDFLQLDATKPVKVGLPVRLTGNSRGVMAGGKLLQVFRRLTVVGLPSQLPEAITIDITKLRIGFSIRVSQIETDGLKFLEPENAVVVAVKMARGAAKGSDAYDDEEEEA